MSEPAGPLLVLDSASLYYRSFFALPEKMTAPDGRPHNAVRGFLSTVARLVDAWRPTGLVACWDNDWRPTWRVDLIESYKEHRVAQEDGAEAEPESLGAQAVAIADLLDAIGLARWGVDGYEADDVIGSVTAQAGPAGRPCIVVSGDRDLVQVIDDRTRLLLTVNGGMDRWPLLDPAAALERFGVPATAYVDMAVLRGDPSDGLPGVPGIGAKTAVALVTAFGSLDGIVAAADDDPVRAPMTARLAATVRAHADTIGRARQVASVVRDLPLPTPVPVGLAGRLDAGRVDSLAASWGVRRQVDDLVAALRRADAGHTDEE